MSDYTAEFANFDDTAAFVSALDLVITVCTSVAHLSGALGQRTWVLLDVNPHWVWLLDRPDSPWYPSATLYRQPQFGQWDPALEAVARDLSVLAARRHAA
jgi:ADP-heptose:LPS heptosyltransferase